MAHTFEPYNKKPNNENEFSVWEYQVDKGQEEAEVIDEHAVFLAECENLRADAIKKGYEEGLEKAHVEIDAKKKEFSRWLDLIKNPIQLIDEQITQEIIQTILCLSQHCIAVELTINPDKLRDLINEIKAELPSLNNHRTLAMHPQDVAWLQAELDENELPGLQEILVADPTLSRGDFYLKGEHSELDGRVHTRLATLFAKYITKDNLMAPIKVQD